MRRHVLALSLILFSAAAFAEDAVVPESARTVAEEGETGESTAAKTPVKEIRLTSAEALAIGVKMIEDGDLENARLLLSNISFKDDERLETERRFLLGQIEMKRENYGGAIDIFRGILNDSPSLPRVRLDLALAYMQTGSFYKADYHFRLAMSEQLPEEVQLNVYRMLYYIRQNKNWNLWLNVGVAPDSNINNANSGEQCILTIWGRLCNKLPEEERDVGFTAAFGGNYEFKLSDAWRIKNDFAVMTSKYRNEEYDDMLLSASTGPRYVFERGDVWLALAGSRRWLGHTDYSYSAGAKLDANYDLTQKLSSQMSLRYMPAKYDEYDDLDGEVYGAGVTFSYTLSSSKYLVFRTGYDKERNKVEAYRNSRRTYAVGFGSELPLGFSIYLEPSLMLTGYDEERLYVVEPWLESIRRKDRTYRYSEQLLNRKISWYGFTPTLGYSYTDRRSNVWQSEFTKSAFEFGMTQRF
ncbi:MAG: surface lipoprotein assembly modifier [Rickettsiales bacterium]|jgi:hypothetical protein|nr:surface lipoprotein assembly modifier [Rickettsiales bacterium]